MIYINKNNTESKAAADKLKQWRDTYTRPSDGKKFDDLCGNMTSKQAWGFLKTKSIDETDYSKEQLRNALYNEQNEVCCYCVRKVELGNSVEEINNIIEHFIAKGADKCANTYDYDNVLLACNGNKLEPRLIKNGDTWNSLAQKYELSISEIQAHNPQINLLNLPIINTILKFPQPPHHCDKAKLEDPTTIINPTKVDCWNLFKYDADGNVTGKTDLAIETINVLKLDVEPLKGKRKKAWVRAREKFNNEDEFDLSSVENIKKAFEDELKDTYHLCIVHRAYLLNKYPTVLKAYI